MNHDELWVCEWQRRDCRGHARGCTCATASEFRPTSAPSDASKNVRLTSKQHSHIDGGATVAMQPSATSTFNRLFACGYGWKLPAIIADGSAFKNHTSTRTKIARFTHQIAVKAETRGRTQGGGLWRGGMERAAGGRARAKRLHNETEGRFRFCEIIQGYR
jgi:hypothetical protein